MSDFVLIIHDVENYATWKGVFDAAEPLRHAAGETRFQVLCDSNDANRVVHFSHWTSLDAARRFFESPELVDIREAAGVKAPEFLYLTQRDGGTL